MLDPSRMGMVPNIPSGERVYAIGDVHGRIDLLTSLLATIRRDNDARPAAKVRLILVGDLVDRGPASAEVVAQCRAQALRHDRFTVLKGNHEAVMVDALRGSFPALAFWLRHGGDVALASWGVPADVIGEEPSLDLYAAAKARVPSETIAWLNGLPLSYRRGNCLFVHAGIRPGVRLSKQSATDLLWIRDDFVNSTVALRHIVVHGHTIEESTPCLRHGRLGIDTGAYRTGRLTAVGIEGGDYWTLSTGERATAVDELDYITTIDESVDAILALPVAMSASNRFGVTARQLAVGSALTASLLAVGTAAVFYERSPDLTPNTASVTAATPLRPGTIRQMGSAPIVTIQPVPGSPVPVTGEAAADRIATLAAPKADRTPSSGFARSSLGQYGDALKAERRSVDRSPPVRAVGNGNAAPPDPSGASSASVALEGRVPPRGTSDSSVLRAVDEPPLKRIAALTNEAVVTARPTSGATAASQAAKERSDALDAIRMLRRQ